MPRASISGLTRKRGGTREIGRENRAEGLAKVAGSTGKIIDARPLAKALTGGSFRAGDAAGEGGRLVSFDATGTLSAMSKFLLLSLLAAASTLTGCAAGDGRTVASEAPATAQPTRTYSRDRFDRTGEQTPGEALARVDPAVTITRGGR